MYEYVCVYACVYISMGVCVYVRIYVLLYKVTFLLVIYKPELHIVYVICSSTQWKVRIAFLF